MTEIKKYNAPYLESIKNSELYKHFRSENFVEKQIYDIKYVRQVTQKVVRRFYFYGIVFDS